MAIESTFNSTPLDDIKDLAWLTHDRIGLALDSLSGRGVEIHDANEGWAFDELDRAALETLASYIPDMHVTEHGLACFETEEAYKLAHTYDDGTSLVEHITFPDAEGITFTYRPRHDKPREEFMAWAREEATKHAEDTHNRYVSVGDLGIEYIGIQDEAFHAHLGEDAHVTLSRAQVKELRAGLTRILATQARAGEASEAVAGEEWVEAKAHGDEGSVYVCSFNELITGAPGIDLESFTNADGPARVRMSAEEARQLAALILEEADAADHSGFRWEDPSADPAFTELLRTEIAKADNNDQARIPEILEAVTAGTETEEQLGCVVELPGGRLKTWADLTAPEIETLRRAHSF